YWSGGRLRLPWTAGWAWNREHLAFEISAERIDGRHVPLRRSMADDVDDPLHELVSGIMKPLQRCLVDAGFDGQVWQAGLGNPTAAGNFMLESGPRRERRWVWVDMESGVPPLFPIDPGCLLGFYLPRCIRRGRLLFDDVDV